MVLGRPRRLLHNDQGVTGLAGHHRPCPQQQMPDLNFNRKGYTTRSRTSGEVQYNPLRLGIGSVMVLKGQLQR
jgi:hypothetical protein